MAPSSGLRRWPPPFSRPLLETLLETRELGEQAPYFRHSLRVERLEPPVDGPDAGGRAQKRVPMAILDRGSARRPVNDQAGTRKTAPSRTRKHHARWQTFTPPDGWFLLRR